MRRTHSSCDRGAAHPHVVTAWPWVAVTTPTLGSSPLLTALCEIPMLPKLPPSQKSHPGLRQMLVCSHGL